MELCMQLKAAMVRKFEMSPEYQELRQDRQRIWSKNVLKFIADKGLEPVRRCTIRRAFMAGGKDRLRHKDMEVLSDAELRRILDRLVAAHCLIKHEDVPAHMAAKGRTKPDVYYYLNVIGVSQACVSSPMELENYDRAFELAISELDGRKAMLTWARKDLMTTNWKKISDEAMVRWLDMFGQIFHRINEHEILRWAESLPDDEAPLREQIKGYIGRKKDSKGPEVVS